MEREFLSERLSGSATTPPASLCWWLSAQADNGMLRFFCRSVESTGMTGFSGLDEPVMKPLVVKDWRFGLCAPGLATLSRARGL